MKQLSIPTLIMILILILAFVLRVWGASFGLPYVYHPDEGFEVNRALQLGTGELDFSFYRMLKGGYFYLLFVEYGFLFVILKLLGHVQSVQDFALLYVRDPTAFYLVGRVTTAAIGTLSVYLLYRISARISSPRVGLIAAALLAINVLHVVHSHFITVDIPLSCLCLACLLFIIRIYETGDLKDYLWASVFLGLATITKLPGIVLVVPLAAAHFWRNIERNGLSFKTIFDAKILAVGLVFLVVFFVSNIGALLHFQEFLENIGRLLGAGGSISTGESSRSFQSMYYLRVLYEAMGLLLLIFAIVGICVATHKKAQLALIFLLFWISFFVVISLPTKDFLVYQRYILPIIAVTAFFSAFGIEWFVQQIARITGRPDAVAALLVLALSASPLRATLSADMQFLANDARTDAKEWIEANVPEGTSVLVEGHTAKSLNAGVQLSNSLQNLQEAILLFEAQGESGKAHYFRLEKKIARKRRFDLHFFSWYNVESWPSYARQEFEYVIVRPKAMLGSAKYEGDGEAFLDDLRSDANYCLAIAFVGSSNFSDDEINAGHARRGPTIEIYRRKDGESCEDNRNAAED